MSISQGTAHPERILARTASGSTPVGDEMRSRIADSAAEFIAARVVAEVDALMTDKAWTAYVDALTPRIEAIIAEVTLPPIGSCLIGGAEEEAI